MQTQKLAQTQKKENGKAGQKPKEKTETAALPEFAVGDDIEVYWPKECHEKPGWYEAKVTKVRECYYQVEYPKENTHHEFSRCHKYHMACS